ncbi:CPBP family intramembrane glutamic endopeptidase [Microbacterium ureisolvens]|uniref:CPBP family intramembrane glutamic endopeptidase n=1 Tax=Microbacterium ureisolvens TaxID=2781186 RepID=UPI00362B5F86
MLTASVILLQPRLQMATAGWPQALARLTDLVVLSIPLLVAVFVAARVSGDRFATATGLRGFSWVDAAAGVGIGLIARALVELVAPTVGGIGGGLEVESAGVAGGIVVALAGAVLVTPLIEELFFRGLLQRALGDALAGAGRTVAGVVAVLVSTLAFVALHVVAAGAQVPVGVIVGPLAVGLGCGILTLLTGRLAGAIVAHVVSNAIGVALLIW